jgi:nicotinamide phosphoribosyltransferase
MFLCDAYKCSHAELYDPDCEYVFATWTPRKSRIPGIDKVVVFGPQYVIQEWLINHFNNNFFFRPIEEVVREYCRIMKNCLNSGGVSEKRLRALHKLGYLPLEIKALPEGTLCPIRVPSLSIENTLPEFFWLTNFVESFMSAELWGPTTSATLALQYRKILQRWADKTCDSDVHVDFQAHDFSFRGLKGVAAGLSSSAGHLTVFKGTDTVPAIPWLEYYYGADSDTELVGTSIPATEHSIMCFNSVGVENDEYEAFKRIITKVHPNGFVSIVSDTWNLWNVLTKTIPGLKAEILARDGKVVIRPDSGDPVDIICGREISLKDLIDIDSKEFGYSSCVEKGVIELLWDTFGGVINSKGYKVLDSHIGCIYGDAITLERAEMICQRLEAKGFASSNIVLGVGSYTYQMNTRDTFGFALKSTYGVKAGKEVFLFKDPITDDGTKKSQKGLVAVVEENGTLNYVDGLSREEYEKIPNNLLTTVFKDGKLVRRTNLKTIRHKVLNTIKQPNLSSVGK